MFSFAGDTVLDPFAGTGSTTSLPWRRAGIRSPTKSNPTYLEAARNRYNETEAAGSRFTAARASVSVDRRSRRADRKNRHAADYRLLAAFKALFEGWQYRHRSSAQGDRVA